MVAGRDGVVTEVWRGKNGGDGALLLTAQAHPSLLLLRWQLH